MQEEKGMHQYIYSSSFPQLKQRASTCIYMRAFMNPLERPSSLFKTLRTYATCTITHFHTVLPQST